MSNAHRTEIDSDSDSEPELAANTKRVRAADADEAAQTLIRHVLERVRASVRRRPIAAVSGAFVAGCVLGNGIPRFVAQTAVSMGLRALIERAFASGSAADLN